MKLKDKVAIITGGSRGIGYATADKFLAEGATVILTARSQTSAEKAVERLKEKYPKATIAGISPDLASLESVREAFRTVTKKYGCGHGVQLHTAPDAHTITGRLQRTDMLNILFLVFGLHGPGGGKAGIAVTGETQADKAIGLGGSDHLFGLVFAVAVDGMRVRIAQERTHW